MASEETPIKMFSKFQKFFEEEQIIREELKSVTSQLDKKTREIIAFVQDIHHDATKQKIKDVCDLIKTNMLEIVDHIKKLSAVVPPGEYYRFHDHWRNMFQRIVFLCAFSEYFQTGQLISNISICNNLQICHAKEDGFHLDLDDYLIGVLQMSSELSRVSINCVIAGDYEQPVKIGKFLCELDGAFRLLHLKNDGLRKRFDVLKYDLKKVEEVVYDLSIRGLVKKVNP